MLFLRRPVMATPTMPADEPPVADAPKSNNNKRKQRPPPQRIQIACERCRQRKHKCDGQIPVCSTCQKAGTPCIVVDRLTYRQYPRGHVEALERENELLRARAADLEAKLASVVPQSEHVGTPGPQDDSGILTRTSLDQSSLPSKYVGEASGSFFGKIMQAMLLQSDYKHEQGPKHNKLRLRVRSDENADSPLSRCEGSEHCEFPSPEVAQKLQEEYFRSRWAMLPFLHKPTFMELHFQAVMKLQRRASSTSLFLFFAVMCLGAIDARRHDPGLGDIHLLYFATAMHHYLDGLMRTDDIETVQGLLLVANIAISEAQSVNAWLAAGQAVRLAIDLGLHRPSEHSNNTLLRTEIRKRVFWSSYALDCNISFALGRPCAIRDVDINLDLPLCLSDRDLLNNVLSPNLPSLANREDMSTFIHVIRVRSLQSTIRDTFYPAKVVPKSDQNIQEIRNAIRASLDEWIASAPRYSGSDVATFQSAEWFQLSYSHSLLLLYRPSPLCPTANNDSLRVCSDASISLITSYTSLYAKNKIIYTWIALHSIFMASITMLYTLWVSSEIRSSTRQQLVKSNIAQCLMLVEAMRDVWPLAARCYDTIEQLGNATINLYERHLRDRADIGPQREIGAQYMDWFETRDHRQQTTQFEGDMQPTANTQQDLQAVNDGMDANIASGLFSDLDDLFHQGFDMSLLPIMTEGFDPTSWT